MTTCPEAPKGGWTFTTLYVHVVGLIEAAVRRLTDIMDERDRRYAEVAQAGKDAVAAALTAAKELVAAAFQSAEKAREKADEAQKSYDFGHNDLIKKSAAELSQKVGIEKFEALADRVDKLELHTGSAGSRAIGWKDAAVVLLILSNLALAVWAATKKG